MSGILDGLADGARRQPDVAAMLLPISSRRRAHGPARRGAAGYRATTFRQLEQRSDVLAAGLVACGVTDGARAGLLVPPGDDLFALSFALLKAGAVPVLIDPGIGTSRLRRCLAEAEPSAFLGSPKARVARAVLRWAPHARAIGVKRLERIGRAGLPLRAQPRGDHETAAILFTSGSTGPPKGVEYRHPQFAAQVRVLRALYGLQPGAVSLATFPPFALLGPALGLTTVIPRMDPTRPAMVDPREIIEAASVFEASVMFGSPALLRTVGRYAAATGARLPALMTVVSAGAPVPEPVVRDVVAMLGEGGRVVTPYGATEALPVSSIGSEELLDLPPRPRCGVCVGRPVPGVEVVIAPIHDGPLASVPDPLPDGEIGEIVVRGPVVTESYLSRESPSPRRRFSQSRWWPSRSDGHEMLSRESPSPRRRFSQSRWWPSRSDGHEMPSRGSPSLLRPDATALAKLDWGGRLAHRMGDLGRMDDLGRLWFCGRVAHRVVTAEETLYPLPCEEVFAVHPSVARAALVGVGPPAAQQAVLCVELEKRVRPDAALTDELLGLGAAQARTRRIRTVLYHPRFPVDIRHNAKVDYAALARWSARRL